MANEPFAPRPVSDKVHRLEIEGYALPWLRIEQPVIVKMHGTDDWFIPIFSTAKKLRLHLAQTKIHYDSIKQITDQIDFLVNIPYRTPEGDRIRIIIDPHIVKGNTRFIELKREDA